MQQPLKSVCYEEICIKLTLAKIYKCFRSVNVALTNDKLIEMC